LDRAKIDSQEKDIAYDEGSVFMVPIKQGTNVIGIVVRKSNINPSALGYFLENHTDDPCAEACSLNGEKAKAAFILTIIFVDSQLTSGNWPLLGRIPNWSRQSWPIPDLCEKNPLTKRAMLIRLCDNDIDEIESMTPISYENSRLS